MRGLVIFLIVLAVIASFSFIAVNTNSISSQKSEPEEPAKKHEFSTFTSAVCENKDEFVHCRDEVFVNCNGEISKVADVAECDGFRFDIPKATGAAVFDKEWKDPRNN